MRKRIISLLLAVLCTAACIDASVCHATETSSSPFIQQEYQLPSDYQTYHGIEVSYIQENGVINWMQAKRSGVDFAFVRLNGRTGDSFALSQDAYFDIRIQGAASAGLPIGISLCSQAITLEESVQEAEFMLHAAEKYDIKLPLLLRFEPDSSLRILDAIQSGALSKDDITKNISEFCRRVNTAGYQPMLLASQKTFKQCIDQDVISASALLCLSDSGSSYYDAQLYPYRHYSDVGRVSGIPNTVSCLFYFTKERLPGMTPTADELFQDVQASDYFCSAVTYCYQHKIMSGVSEDMFSPRTYTSRAMAARILYNLEGMPAVDFVPYYSDVPNGQWFSDAVTWARETGVMDGYGSSFGVNDAITREQFATILYRYSKLKGLDSSVASTTILQQYQDASLIHDYAQTAMQWAVQNGLIQGYSSAELAPRDHTRRCDCAVIFQRYHSGFAASIFNT